MIIYTMIIVKKTITSLNRKKTLDSETSGFHPTIDGGFYAFLTVVHFLKRLVINSNEIEKEDP